MGLETWIIILALWLAFLIGDCVWWTLRTAPEDRDWAHLIVVPFVWALTSMTASVMFFITKLVVRIL